MAATKNATATQSKIIMSFVRVARSIAKALVSSMPNQPRLTNNLLKLISCDLLADD